MALILDKICIIFLFQLIFAFGQEKCLGEFQGCSISGGYVCAMDCANATLCKNTQYV